jgi:predicted phosphatase
MKKSFFLVILTTFMVFPCYAAIETIQAMEAVLQYFSNTDSDTTWAIFDIDGVLVQSKIPAFQKGNTERFPTVREEILQGLTPYQRAIFATLTTIRGGLVLVEKDTPRILKKLQNEGIITMALTANVTGSFSRVKNMAKKRVRVLNKLRIKFSKAAPYKGSIVFNYMRPYRGNYPEYLSGILFMNGFPDVSEEAKLTKGEFFVKFCEKIKKFPKRVVFIDDHKGNLESVEDALQKLDQSIEYLGLHYVGAQKYPSKKIDEKEFKTCWEKLALKAKKIE